MTFPQRRPARPLPAALVELGRLAKLQIRSVAGAIHVSNPAGPVQVQPQRFDLLSSATARLPDASATRFAPARRNRPGKFAHPPATQFAGIGTESSAIARVAPYRPSDHEMKYAPLAPER